MITANHKKSVHDVRVRRRADPGDRSVACAPALAKIGQTCTRLAALCSRARRCATKMSSRRSPVTGPDIEKSRAEAKRLLKEAGAEGLTFELMNRNVDQHTSTSPPG